MVSNLVEYFWSSFQNIHVLLIVVVFYLCALASTRERVGIILQDIFVLDMSMWDLLFRVHAAVGLTTVQLAKKLSAF